jgi:hypothetical protein
MQYNKGIERKVIPVKNKIELITAILQFMTAIRLLIIALRS